MRDSKVAVLFLVLAILLILPAFSGDREGELDVWTQAFTVVGVPRRTILSYHQFPFWNPWTSGGIPHLGYPRSSFLSPGFILPLMFGPVDGLRVRVLLGLWIGLLGGYMLGTQIAPGRSAPYLCASVFLLSSWYPLYMTQWFAEFIPFAYFPWLLLFYLKGLDRLRWCALGGAVLALMLLEGGTYPVPYALLFLLLCALIAAASRRSAAPLVAWILIVLIGFSISGIKLLPMVHFLSRNPRFTYWREPVLPLRALPRMFFGRDQLSPTDFQGAWLGWWEYGAYVGVVPFALAAAALVLSPRKAVLWGALGLLFFGLMFGDYGSFSPWRWLHTVPPFSSLHDTVRFRIITVFCLTLMGAAAVSRLEGLSHAGGNRLRPLLSLMIVMGVVAVVMDLVAVSAPLYGRLSIVPPAPPPRSGEFRQVCLPEKERPSASSYYCFLRNEGLINNMEGLELPPADLRAYRYPGYKGEVWLARGVGTVLTRQWSPNRLTYSLDLTAQDTLVINQRYDPGWRASDGRPLTSLRGLIALPVYPSDSEVHLFYLPVLFTPGCIVSLCGLLLALAVWKKA
jgi:hypothetical protein